jgi:hypothetical protein
MMTHASRKRIGYILRRLAEQIDPGILVPKRVDPTWDSAEGAYITAGFNPESVAEAVRTGDLNHLKHTGLDES